MFRLRVFYTGLYEIVRKLPIPSRPYSLENSISFDPYLDPSFLLGKGSDFRIPTRDFVSKEYTGPFDSTLCLFLEILDGDDDYGTTFPFGLDKESSKHLSSIDLN